MPRASVIFLLFLIGCNNPKQPNFIVGDSLGTLQNNGKLVLRVSAQPEKFDYDTNLIRICNQDECEEKTVNQWLEKSKTCILHDNSELLR